MNLDKRVSKAAKRCRANCSKGLHEIVVVHNGTGHCVHCDCEVKPNEAYLQVSTIAEPPTYRLKSIYSDMLLRSNGKLFKPDYTGKHYGGRRGNQKTRSGK